MTRGRDEGVSARSQRSAWERSQDAPRSELETGMFVKRLIDLPLAEIEPLLVGSRAEGYNFVDRLADDYADDSNRFDKPGEALFGVYGDGRPEPGPLSARRKRGPRASRLCAGCL